MVTKDDTTIINEGTEDVVKEHCESLRKQIKVSDDAYQREQLQDRIAKLSGGVAVIKVGAVTETEMKDKKLRLEDAINATRAAVEEGIVPGGGTMVFVIMLVAVVKSIWNRLPSTHLAVVIRSTTPPTSTPHV